ncbi:MAG TPA: ABC transporter permease subunit, partial [Trueperaceae bacterium]
IAAVLLAAVAFWLRRRQIVRSERPGQAWPIAVIVLVLVAAAGYFAAGSGLPNDIAVEFLADRGRGTVYADTNQDGIMNAGEHAIAFAPTRVEVDKGALRTLSQDFTESGSIVRSTFRFPPIQASEFDSADVHFADPDATQGLSIRFDDFPSEGLIYQDRNNNDAFDPGEQLRKNGGGYSGIPVIMVLEGFHRRIVSSREGLVRIPDFETEDALKADQEERDVNLSPRALFGRPQDGPDTSTQEATVDVDVNLLPAGPLVLSKPSVPGTNYFGGMVLSTSYLAILLALVVYTSSFIAEIVRAGILAVPKGQTEAAKSLGLSGFQTFSLIVFPQSLRIILPPMISQYLNLTKNSSLGTLATYAEIFAVSVIIANQTGASVPVILMIIVAYIIISLIFALVLNIINARMALVER